MVKKLEAQVADLKSKLREQLELGIKRGDSDRAKLEQLTYADRQAKSPLEPRRTSGSPNEEDRQRYMALSDKAREKFIERMRESRDEMMKATPEERKKFAKDMFDKAEAEDKAGRNEAPPKPTPSQDPEPKK